MGDIPSLVALIPARAGSKRVPGKNVRLLAGHPMIAYTIAVALKSEIFAEVIVSTDSERYASIARHYGAEVPFLRPDDLAGDMCPDIDWVKYTLDRLGDDGRTFDCFSILRPTNPFRQPETVRRAWRQFLDADGIDSIRAVEKCAQHPGKMWVLRGNRMFPLLPLSPEEQPWHSSQYQALPEVFVQNASLEIAWTRVAVDEGTIAGSVVVPFLTETYEGFDINQPGDCHWAEELAETGEARLPVIDRPPFQI